MNSAGSEGTVCCVLLMKHGLLWHPDTTDHNSVRKNRTGPCLLNLAALHSPKKKKLEESMAGKVQTIKTIRIINAFVIEFTDACLCIHK